MMYITAKRITFENVKCKNCGHIGVLEIDFGFSLDSDGDSVPNRYCRKCGTFDSVDTEPQTRSEREL